MRIRARLHRAFPERRLFLKSDSETRFVRLSTGTQIVALGGSALLVGWTIIASSILLMNALGAGNLREQSARQQQIYETRLNAMAAARDDRAEEARLAHERFTKALAEVSAMQTLLLESENGRRELAQGIDVIQDTLRRTMAERDAARHEAGILLAKLDEATAPIADDLARLREVEATVDLLADALGDTAVERDEVAAAAVEAQLQIETLELEAKLAEERNDRIFRQLEEAVSVSMEPLNEMFRAANLPADRILETVRRGYSGQGGPLTPLTFSTKGQAPDPDTLRANGILERLDALNLYRIAVQKTPFAMPVKSAFRYTSGFGTRSDPKTGRARMHEGTDFAGLARDADLRDGRRGRSPTPTGMAGYGRLVRIQPRVRDRDALRASVQTSRVRVEGQRVSKGDSASVIWAIQDAPPARTCTTRSAIGGQGRQSR
jgi:hypothetical protein